MKAGVKFSRTDPYQVAKESTLNSLTELEFGPGVEKRKGPKFKPA